MAAIKIYHDSVCDQSISISVPLLLAGEAGLGQWRPAVQPGAVARFDQKIRARVN